MIRIPNLAYLNLSSNLLNGPMPSRRLSDDITTIHCQFAVHPWPYIAARPLLHVSLKFSGCYLYRSCSYVYDGPQRLKPLVSDLEMCLRCKRSPSSEGTHPTISKELDIWNSSLWSPFKYVAKPLTSAAEGLAQLLPLTISEGISHGV
ncbi:hypothetical protein MKW98_013315 [Papaver atlanticum]|uniref:Uncharacterized protein n=1 Tax=Papaver atlanticum TaxID=357466 RepID=A0AAD4XKH1_9MAGN|nr:hypothetical protein MKW98_013315 [Papaver atlanticum]